MHVKHRYLQTRNEIFQYRRAVPPDLRHIYGREFVKSLKTSDIEEAIPLWMAENKRINALIASANCDVALTPAKSEEIRQLASDLGLTPVDTLAIDVGSQELRDAGNIIAAIKNIILAADWNSPSGKQASALATTVQTSVSFEEVGGFYEEHTRDRWSSKNSARERQKFYQPIYAAIADFMAIVPNDNVLSLSPKDVDKFRADLITKVEQGQITAHTANKKIMNLRKILKAFFAVQYRDKKNPFDGVKLKDFKKGKRPPFNDAEIAAIVQLLNRTGSNEELVAINFIAMNTGATCKEICLLTGNDIHVDAEIPFIRISENELRDKVKSGGARHRDVPLLGDALSYAKKFPEGFSRYQRSNGSEAVSAASNKMLRAVTGKTFYSYRHRIADRLRNSYCSDSLKDSILGHATPGMGMHYGSGFSLAVKRHALAVALGIPVASTAGIPE